jgi:chromosome segregation ATPase
MAGRTISQRLDELAERVGGHIPKTEHRMDEVEDELHALAADVRKLEALPQQVADLRERVKQLEELPQQSARHDERLKTVEKTTDKTADRRWQLAPMAISVVALLVSVVIAFVKK